MRVHGWRSGGATEKEVSATVEEGERSAARHGRWLSRRNFPTDGRDGLSTKQIEAYWVDEDDRAVVVTVIVKYF